ncbi:MAG: NAD(P)H-dependent flavin oxidoreductase [Anaerorhabdus sp.]
MKYTLKIKDKMLPFPIIQGGMGVGVSLSSLAGNVMKQGCMGVISAAHPGYRASNFRQDSITANVQAILEESKKAREISGGKGLLAINIMAASKDYITYVKAAVRAKIDAIISGAGLPLDLPSYVEDNSILLAPIVSSGKAAKLICRAWDKRHNKIPDFIVIESSEAGGHLGFKKDDLLEGKCELLDVIFHDVKKEILPFEEKYQKQIPIILAGGIFDGKDIANALKLGASGVQMGTRFIATNECDVAQEFKDMVINCKKEDIAIVNSPTGFPGRAIMNKFMKVRQNSENISVKSCLNCLTPCNPSFTPYCISEALIQAAKGNVDHGLVFVGSNAYRVNKMVSVKELIEELIFDMRKELGEVL